MDFYFRDFNFVFRESASPAIWNPVPNLEWRAILESPESTRNYIVEWVIEIFNGYLFDGQPFTATKKIVATRESNPPPDLPFWLGGSERIITEGIAPSSLLPERWVAADLRNTVRYYEYNPENDFYQSDLDSGNYANADFASNPIIVDGFYSESDFLADEYQAAASRKLLIETRNPNETYEIQSDSGVAKIEIDSDAERWVLVGLEFDGVGDDILADVTEYEISGSDIYGETAREFLFGTSVQPGKMNDLDINIGTPETRGNQYIVFLTARSDFAFINIRLAEVVVGNENLPLPFYKQESNNDDNTSESGSNNDDNTSESGSNNLEPEPVTEDDNTLSEQDVINSINNTFNDNANDWWENEVKPELEKINSTLQDISSEIQKIRDLADHPNGPGIRTSSPNGNLGEAILYQLYVKQGQVLADPELDPAAQEESLNKINEIINELSNLDPNQGGFD